MNLSLDLIKMGMVIVFLLAFDFVGEMLLVRNVKDRKRSFKLRVFLRYLLLFIFIFSMAKIWVEGFSTFVTFLGSIIGIIAAALTITQKEYLMNVVGWLIIMWRDFFAEGDYIEIGRHTGFVKAIGPLYFTLEEADQYGDKTGRFVKVPNSLTANHSMINFSMEQSFIESKSHFIFTMDSSVVKLKELMVLLEKEVERLLSSLYGNWTSHEQRKHNHIAQFSYYRPQCILRIIQEKDKPAGIQLRVRYLSLKHDKKNIEDNIFTLVMKMVGEHGELTLNSNSLPI